MKEALIVAAGRAVRPGLLAALAAKCERVVAVDGGYLHCRAAGLRPQSLWGDMDSLPPSLVEEARDLGTQVERIPCEKDDTDTLYALRRLQGEGMERITIACALGGRLDHLVANLQTLLFAARGGISCRLVDDGCEARALLPGTHRVAREDYRLFSLFSLGDCCEGVTIVDARYPLHGYRLENAFPIGVSNAFTGEEALVSFRSGQLLLIRCREES